jgi:hypothetical protein
MIAVAILSCLGILVVLWDAFEAMVLPRRVTRRIRVTKLFYRCTWIPWAAIARRMRKPKRRETFLSYYGPLSMLFLMVVWATGLIFGFAALHWSLGDPVQAPESTRDFATYFYLSGTTFFTLGFGDVTPTSEPGRMMAVLEAGLGFGFLALVIGYLPVFYQAFSRREVSISMLDARAGSPASAAELLRRYGQAQKMDALNELLQDWERWAAELMESHLSYPVLCFFRSQHDNQSWLGALTTIVDASALVMAGFKGAPQWQARLTFAMARHAVVDISQILNTPPRPPEPDRLPPGRFAQLRASLEEAGVSLCKGDRAAGELVELRRSYEPYVNALSHYLAMPLPEWVRTAPAGHNWQTSAWERKAARLDPPVSDDHV